MNNNKKVMPSWKMERSISFQQLKKKPSHVKIEKQIFLNKNQEEIKRSFSLSPDEPELPSAVKVKQEGAWVEC